MAAAPAPGGGDRRPGHVFRSQEDCHKEEGRSDESQEEEEVESDDGEGSDVDSLAGLWCPDAGSDEDPTFDPDADGDLEVEAVLRARLSRMSISASARKGRKESALPKIGKEETDLLAMVDKLMQDGQLEKLKVYECKAYLRMHKLRLTGNKEVLLNRIREHIEVKNHGEVKYPLSSFVLNCKGDACKGDVVMFEQNIYRREKGAPREVKGRLCGQRTNAGRIIKESYGTAKQQHTFTIEILWSKGYKPWPPLHPLLIKGRNLYKDRTMRQPWPDEEERNRVIQEKHERGFLARKSRAARIHEKETEKLERLNRMKDNKMKKHCNMNKKQPQEPQQKVESTDTVQRRASGRKGPYLQNGEYGNGRQQPISSKATSTHHNEVLADKGSTRTFKSELIDFQVPSIQHGLQQKILLEPTHTQRLLKNSSSNQSFQQQNDVVTQEGAMETSRKAFIDHVPSLHNRGSGDTRQHQLSSKPTSIFKTQQVPKYQDNNEQDGLKRTYEEQLFDHQKNTYHATEYGNSPFQPHGKVAQHASGHQHGSNYHQNAEVSRQAHQPHSSRNQYSDYCATEYIDSSFQHRAKFSQHASAYQHHSNSHKNALTHRQVHQPFRPRNRDFNSSDQFYDQEYYQGYDEYRGVTRGQYHSQQSRHQNYYGHRPMTQGQYGTQQKHHQNYSGRRKTNQIQYNSRENQPHQQLLEWQKPCRYYYQQGWCPYRERCWYSHDI